jgi:hypothetical protein
MLPRCTLPRRDQRLYRMRTASEGMMSERYMRSQGATKSDGATFYRATTLLGALFDSAHAGHSRQSVVQGTTQPGCPDSRLMRALVAAALLAIQPDTSAEVVHGVVLRHDGTAAVDGVPSRPCVLVAQTPGDSSAGVSLDLPVERAARVGVILPSGIATNTMDASQGHRLDLRSADRAGPLGRLPGSATITGRWRPFQCDVVRALRPDAADHDLGRAGGASENACTRRRGPDGVRRSLSVVSGWAGAAAAAPLPEAATKGLRWGGWPVRREARLLNCGAPRPPVDVHC